jgi:hypothetical protein
LETEVERFLHAARLTRLRRGQHRGECRKPRVADGTAEVCSNGGAPLLLRDPARAGASERDGGVRRAAGELVDDAEHLSQYLAAEARA